MRITYEMFKEAYKTYNILKGYSEQKLNIEPDGYKFNQFTKSFNINNPSKEDAKYFGQILGVLIFQEKTGKTILPPLTNIELVDLNVGGIHEISEEMKRAMLNNIENEVEDIKKIDYIGDDGFVKERIETRNEPNNEFNINYKYNIEMDLSNVLDNIDNNKVNNIYQSIKHYTNNGKEIFDADELNNNPNLNITRPNDLTQYKKDVATFYNRSNNIKVNPSKTRKKQLENELKDKVQVYLASKKAVNEKSWASRYLNPFNWGKTYRENQNLKRMEKDFKENYGFEKEEFEFLNAKLIEPTETYNVGRKVLQGANYETSLKVLRARENPKLQFNETKKANQKTTSKIEGIQTERMDITDFDKEIEANNNVYDFKNDYQPQRERDNTLEK